MQKQKGDKILRLLTLGNSMVGKTSIISRFIEDKFYSSYISTIGIDFFKKRLEIGKKIFDLNIFDSAGQEKYRSISKQYYHHSEGILLVFDLTSQESFSSIYNWIEEIENEAENGLPIVLAGNKSDLGNREVSQEEIQKLKNDKKLEYFETSAFNGSNINEAFIKLTELVIKHKEQLKDKKKGVSISELTEKNKKKCC